MSRRAALAVVVLGSLVVPPRVAHARAQDGEDVEDPTFVDPRKRQLPPPHRFRLGLEIGYMRLSAAVDADTGEKQRFHFVPMLASFAYQAQFLKRAMVRPELGMGVNLGNTIEAMPFIIHPQFHIGYQGALVGAAVGYGYFHPIPARKDVISENRGGLGQPVTLHNHHIGGELSFTTRVDKGALSFILRVMGVNGRTQHFDLNKRRWRFMFTFNMGWYFGTGAKQRARQEQRRREKAAQEEREF
jgi:hypothetical protein